MLKACLGFLFVLLALSDSGSAYPQNFAASDDDPPPLQPLVLVPGIAGSGLLASLQNATLEECGYTGKTVESPYRLWVALSSLMKYSVKCWAQTMSLKFDEHTGVYSVPPGVTIGPEAFRQTKGLEWLDYVMGYGVYGTSYMSRLVKTLKGLGYVEGENLMGAPYDWRLPGNQIEWSLFKALIEDTVKANQQKVTIVAHSLGGVHMSYFLREIVDEVWKQKHIESMVTIATPWGGSFKAVKGLISGYRDLFEVEIWRKHFDLVDPIIIRDAYRSFGSIYDLLPRRQLWDEKEPFLYIGKSPPAGLLGPSSRIGGQLGEVDFEREVTDVVSRDGGERSDKDTEAATSSSESPSASSVWTSVSDFFSSLLGRLSPKENTGGKSGKEGDVGGEASSSAPSSSPAAAAAVSLLQSDSPLSSSSAKEEGTNKGGESVKEGREKKEREGVLTEMLFGKSPPPSHPSKDSPVQVYSLSNWTSALIGRKRQETAHTIDIKTMAAEKRAERSLRDPGVPVKCLYSSFEEKTTDLILLYPDGNLEDEPQKILDFGDNTVPLKSLEVCKQWNSTVFSGKYPNLDHQYILDDPAFLASAVPLITGVPPEKVEVALKDALKEEARERLSCVCVPPSFSLKKPREEASTVVDRSDGVGSVRSEGEGRGGEVREFAQAVNERAEELRSSGWEFLESLEKATEEAWDSVLNGGSAHSSSSSPSLGQIGGGRGGIFGCSCLSDGHHPSLSDSSSSVRSSRPTATEAGEMGVSQGISSVSGKEEERESETGLRGVVMEM
uniref:Uncharacterized protein n=1 Tax=Chromera velia CCMP2878 TaxID=1169474 RepID=A0A0G4HGU0_9ALVE|eukprot:Cvel_1031.t1-p1 / transcript=Cvel_1031.t1 / gene=Cvel_1031 / organism=Chromera_velia_CCMP2878 / gene_product=Group XV phospholipase A2, putative / transcript_product=Group XV phospholipase A2, putative / location=Cvel_scaffold33:132194-136474(-) / protein_length=780 / sequence_SO=supercontig / SO=protein_coding / is_pseudo=false